MTLATFQWEASREGNEGVVVEHRPDGTAMKWRMAANLVPAFVQARRRLIDSKMKKLMGATDAPTQTPTDYSYLLEDDFNGSESLPDHLRPEHYKS